MTSQQNANSTKNLSPVFLHSWFRSGSTYLWSKFRSNDKLTCYYEPLNEAILDLKADQIKNGADEIFISQLRHPKQKEHYFFEFYDLIIKKQIQFDVTFAYDFYFLHTDEIQLKLFKYLNSLINEAQFNYRRPVLCFCRSQLRCGWMKRNFDGLHISHIRNPIDQWKSFKTAGYFLEKVIRIGHSLERSHPGMFSALPKFDSYLKSIRSLPPSNVKSYQNHNLSEKEFFLIFLLIWFVSSIYSINQCDHIIDIDFISSNKIMNSNLQNWFVDNQIQADFLDCDVPRSTVSPAVFLQIKNDLKFLLLRCDNTFIRSFLDIQIDDKKRLNISPQNMEILDLFN